MLQLNHITRGVFTVEQEASNQAVNQLNGQSPNFKTQLAQALEDLVPEAIADGKVDVNKLKELLADDAETSAERFGLFWPGKKQAMRAAQEPTAATLKPAKDLSKDWDTTENIFIEGDNLEVLKVLQKQYHNSIKMIYIDPPYNTGKDFVYPDNFKEGLQNYLEFSKQVDAGGKKINTNAETQGRYHSNWLNMMYPRLKLARNLLTDDGVIFISIDDHEHPHLRKICDEIFGETNYVANFVWEKHKAPKNDNKYISISNEHVLMYARKIELFSRNLMPRSNRNLSGFSNPDNDPRGVWTSGPLLAPTFSEKSVYPITSPSGKVTMPPSGKCWAFSQDSLQKLTADNRIWFGQDGNNTPRIKRFLAELPDGVVPTNMLLHDDIGGTQAAAVALRKLFNGSKYFDFPKPRNLIERLLSISTRKGDVILDFFSGSGTTAHAVMQINAEDGGSRKHIQVQLPEPTDEKSEAYKAGYRKISDIARERINRAGEKIKLDFAGELAKRQTPLDTGYRTYKLSDTNFRKWQSAPTKDLTELQARLDDMRESANDNASQEDLLVEVMLKLGLPLTARIESIDIAGLSVQQVMPDIDGGSASVVFYLNEHIKPTLEQLRAVIAEQPTKFVIIDDAFGGDNQLKTNLVQTCKSFEVELWTV